MSLRAMLNDSDPLKLRMRIPAAVQPTSSVMILSLTIATMIIRMMTALTPMAFFRDFGGLATAQHRGPGSELFFAMCKLALVIAAFPQAWRGFKPLVKKNM